MADFPTPAGPLIQYIDEGGSTDPVTQFMIADYTVPEYLGSSDDRSGLENQMQLLDRRLHRGYRYLVLN